MSTSKKVLSIISFIFSLLTILMVIPTRWIIAFIFRNYSIQIFCSALGIALGIVAVIMAHISRKKKNKPKLSIASITIGYIGIVLCTLFMTIDIINKVEQENENIWNNYNSLYEEYEKEETEEEQISRYVDLKKSECKDNYEDIAYTTLSRNPNDYESRCIHFKGEVIQSLEEFDSNQTQLRVNTKLSDYTYIDNSYTDDTIYVYVYNYDRNNRILENDIIDIYGIYNGIITYESIFGEKISIPSMIALEYNID